ncbi:hypothetical protein [Streptomyces sp. NPDC007172]|uniref:hypothetical protein n=1 Tax=Streptomyces sp. NPDC007172 TaxID=3364776 RepID=UPI00367DB785
MTQETNGREQSMSDKLPLPASKLMNEVREWPLLWFDKKDGDTAKQKVNVLSVGLDYTKIDRAEIALGLTPVKIDWTLFKLDEKGINLVGVTRREWPWIEGKGRWSKAAKEMLQGKKMREEAEKKAEEARQEAEQAARVTADLRKDIGMAKRCIDRLEQSAHGQRGRVSTVAGAQCRHRKAQEYQRRGAANQGSGRAPEPPHGRTRLEGMRAFWHSRKLE